MLLGLGTVVSVGSFRRWGADEHALRLGTSPPLASSARIVSSGVPLVALTLVVLVLVDLS